MIQYKKNFSMLNMKYKNIICGLLGLAMAGCGGVHDNAPKTDWGAMYGTTPVTQPASILYGVGVASLYGDVPPTDGADATPAASDIAVDTGIHRMAVLLPLTGDASAAGREIADAIGLAVLGRKMQNLSVSFHDTGADASAAIAAAVASGPEIIIGPLFADDARALRNAKPDGLPVLSFTSDATAVGNGVMTMALMPTNSIEAIVSDIAADNARGVLILSPDTTAGRQMAGAARRALDTRDVNVAGIYFYASNDTDSMKSVAAAAAANDARVDANTVARAILSDILTNEQLTAIEKSSLNTQLEKLTKAEVLGQLPYNAVLFLGSGDDAKTLASFLRYYGVGARDARFYGTAMWDAADISRDPAMTGAKYAALPDMSAEYIELYTNTTGRAPTRLASFGYDAANLAMGMMTSDAAPARYLMSPGGYTGLDGLVRLTPTGASERALAIMRIDGGLATPVRPAPRDFITPIYSIDASRIDTARGKSIDMEQINPVDYINIPSRLRDKYARVKKSGDAPVVTPVVTTVAPDDAPAITSPEFTPAAPERVTRTLIDAVEING